MTSRSVGCWSPSCCHWRSTAVDLWRTVSEWKGLEEHNREDRTAVPIVKSSVKVWKWKWRYVFRSFLFRMSGNRRTVFAGSAWIVLFLQADREPLLENILTTYFDWISLLMFDLSLVIVVFQYLSPEGLQKVEQTNCLWILTAFLGYYIEAYYMWVSDIRLKIMLISSKWWKKIRPRFDQMKSKFFSW